MSVNLIHTIIDNSDAHETRAAKDWSAVTAITGGGNVAGLLPLADATIDAVARLVEGAPLSTGEQVTAYPRDEDVEYGMQSYVPAFGPSLLSAEKLTELRFILAQDENSEKAAALLDLIIERKLQIRFNGKDHCFARMVAVNWPDDDVEINRSSGNMIQMFRTLGLGHTERENGSEMIDLETFAAAVENRGDYTDMPDRLTAFIACAKRHGSTHVYWA